MLCETWLGHGQALPPGRASAERHAAHRSGQRRDDGRVRLACRRGTSSMALAGSTDPMLRSVGFVHRDGTNDAQCGLRLRRFGHSASDRVEEQAILLCTASILHVMPDFSARDLHCNHELPALNCFACVVGMLRCGCPRGGTDHVVRPLRSRVRWLRISYRHVSAVAQEKSVKHSTEGSQGLKWRRDRSSSVLTTYQNAYA